MRFARMESVVQVEGMAAIDILVVGSGNVEIPEGVFIRAVQSEPSHLLA